MKHVNKKAIVLIVTLISVTLLSGCTDWKRKYENANVLNENLKGQLDFERDAAIAKQREAAQKIAELERKLAEGIPADKATGFDGLQTNVDANAGTITVTVANSILFDSGKETLKSGTIKELDKIASVIQDKYADKQIAVLGHTDTDPIKRSKWADNWELSAQRSLAVVRYLTKQGIADGMITASGCGSSRPVESNTTAAGKAKNRRVEVVVHMF